jgi:hypothetical protein
MTYISPKFKIYLAFLRSSRGPSCFDTGRKVDSVRFWLLSGAWQLCQSFVWGQGQTVDSKDKECVANLIENRK